MKLKRNRKGDPAGTGLNPDVSVNIWLVIALGDDPELPPTLPRRGVCAVADVTSTAAPAEPMARTMAFLPWAGVSAISVMGVVALSLLELFVAFLQAYVFTFLTALFMGMSLYPAH